MSFLFRTSAVFLLGVLSAACSSEEPPDPVNPAFHFTNLGPHQVAYRVVELGDEPLVVKAWYPAATRSDSDEIEYRVDVKIIPFPEPVTVLGNAHLDAAPNAAEGPYPLVVLSHGFALNPEWYRSLAEHLASHGFVVLAPEHTENDWQAGVVPASVVRPAEISQTIDFAENGVLARIIDIEHVAVIGHSYGGYTSLAVAGARFDTRALEARCEGITEGFVAEYYCQTFLENTEQLAQHMGLDAEPAGLWPSLADSRVDAIVSMAGDAYLFGEAGLASVNVPMMALGGTADESTPWDWGTGLTFDSVASEERVLIAFEGADHFITTNVCDDMPWTAGLPEDFRSIICVDPGWDKGTALALINQLTAAFLSHTLRDDPLGRAALDPSLYSDIESLRVNVDLR